MNRHHQGHEPGPAFWGSRYSIGLLVLAGVAAYFLLLEHRAHVVQALPFIFPIICLLLHPFMHGRHGGHHHHGQDGPESSRDLDERKPGDSA